MIPLRGQRNMVALPEMLRVAHRHGVRALVYNVPLRWDVEPPYDLGAYRQWKRELADAAASADAAIFLDLNKLVPNDLWGLHHGRDVDFMHFQGQGHRMLGRRVADAIRTAEGRLTAPARQDTPPSQGGAGGGLGFRRADRPAKHAALHPLPTSPSARGRGCAGATALATCNARAARTADGGR